MNKRKNILKEAGVLLVAAILVLSTIVLFPMMTAQPVSRSTQPAHDVGIASIDKPQDGCAAASMPMQVTVNNYGTNLEVTDVQMEVLKCEDETLLLDEHFNSWPTTWSSYGYELSYTNNAGGTSPEVYYGYYSGHYNNNGWIMTPPVDASDCCRIILEFNLSADFNPSYTSSLYVNWTDDDGVNWHDVTPWVNPVSGDILPSQFIIEIPCDCCACGDNFQVKWEFDGYYYYLQYASGIYLDDVIITGYTGTPEYAELIEDVDVPVTGGVVVVFPNWTPTAWGDPAYECSNVNYCVKAFTLLDDENASNDCKTKHIKLFFDTISPVTLTTSFNPSSPNGDHNWYNTTVTVTIDATDNCGVVDYTKYSLDGGATWTTHTGPWPFSFPVSGCVHAGDFQYYSVDVCGNVETTHTDPTFKVDTVQPVNNINVWKIPIIPPWVCLFIIGWSASDACSGVNRVEFSRNSIFHHQDTTPPYVWITFGNCHNTYSAVVYDNAGNHNP